MKDDYDDRIIRAFKGIPSRSISLDALSAITGIHDRSRLSKRVMSLERYGVLKIMTTKTVNYWGINNDKDFDTKKNRD